MSQHNHQNVEDLPACLPLPLNNTSTEQNTILNKNEISEQEINISNLNSLKPSEALLPTIDDLLSKLRTLYPTLTSVEVDRMLDSNINDASKFLNGEEFPQPPGSFLTNELVELSNYNSSSSPSTHSSLCTNTSNEDNKSDTNVNKIEIGDINNSDLDENDSDENVNSHPNENAQNEIGK
jgi:hypothetical protein